MLKRLNAWLLRRADQRLALLAPQRPQRPRPNPDGTDDHLGLGVPVPVGPRPRRGGAQARPPQPDEVLSAER